jgi:hypothetical protein
VVESFSSSKVYTKAKTMHGFDCVLGLIDLLLTEQLCRYTKLMHISRCDLFIIHLFPRARLYKTLNHFFNLVLKLTMF